jgi:hypothetical protein
VRVTWFSADVDALAEQSNETEPLILLRATYTQSLIQGKFYYVALISGYDLVENQPRAWRYQLHAHTTSRVPKVGSKGTDYEPLGDALTVYLRDGELVQLE